MDKTMTSLRGEVSVPDPFVSLTHGTAVFAVRWTGYEPMQGGGVIPIRITGCAK